MEEEFLVASCPGKKLSEEDSAQYAPLGVICFQIPLVLNLASGLEVVLVTSLWVKVWVDVEDDRLQGCYWNSLLDHKLHIHLHLLAPEQEG